MKPKLLASSNSLTSIKELITRYWYSMPGSIELLEHSFGTYEIIQSNKTMHGYRVKHKGDRFRFEYLKDGGKS